MFDLIRTNIFIQHFASEQMFDRLATSANKASPSGEKQPIRNRIRVTLLYNFSGKTQKALCGLSLFDV